MERSESVVNLARALLEAQKGLDPAKRDALNPYHQSTYADLTSIWSACHKPLGDNGLTIIQTTSWDEAHPLILETTLLHTSGEWVRGKLAMKPVKDDPQSIGSAITYARRYALSAIIGVCTEEEDDDAEGAMDRKGKAAKKATPNKQTAAPKEEASPTAESKGHECPIHNVAFKEHTDKDGGKWWSHRTATGWCNEEKVKASQTSPPAEETPGPTQPNKGPALDPAKEKTRLYNELRQMLMLDRQLTRQEADAYIRKECVVDSLTEASIEQLFDALQELKKGAGAK